MSEVRVAKQDADDKVRLDKWLWAARFYKTRALAKAAIEGGKCALRGERCKPGKEPRVGEEYVIRTGFDERTVVVQALSVVRRGAPEAQTLMPKPVRASCAASLPPSSARPVPWACRPKGGRARSSAGQLFYLRGGSGSGWSRAASSGQAGQP